MSELQEMLQKNPPQVIRGWRSVPSAKIWTIIAILLLFASAAFADAPPQSKPSQPILPTKVAAKAGKPLVLDLSKFPGDVEWFTDDLVDADSVIVDCKRLTFASPYNGDYPVRVAALVNGKIVLAKCVISVKDGVTRPDVPPPDLTDDPNPKLTKQLADLVKVIKSIQDDIVELKKAPRPPPVVDPPLPAAPFKADGLSVLIVYDGTVALPSAQQMVIDGKTMRDYLEAKCVPTPGGKTKEYKIWQADTVTASSPDNWKAAMALPRPSVPYIHISNGRTGFSGPLPATVADTIILIQKYEAK